MRIRTRSSADALSGIFELEYLDFRWSRSVVVHPMSALSKWIAPTENATCWATDGTFRDGRFYLYMIAGWKARNTSWDCGVIVVVSAPTTTGPWTGVFPFPLVSTAMGNCIQTSQPFKRSTTRAFGGFLLLREGTRADPIGLPLVANCARDPGTPACVAL